ncbi:MAG: hypothetical protein JWM59_4504 [Verrucomicrobiales bacterium]|nr:hypothetical protein [Verrucomicrobiales bacterium]
MGWILHGTLEAEVTGQSEAVLSIAKTAGTNGEGKEATVIMTDEFSPLKTEN